MLFPSSSSKEIHNKAGNSSRLANGWTITISILGQYAFLCILLHSYFADLVYWDNVQQLDPFLELKLFLEKKIMQSFHEWHH